VVGINLPDVNIITQYYQKLNGTNCTYKIHLQGGPDCVPSTPACKDGHNFPNQDHVGQDTTNSAHFLLMITKLG